MRIRNIVMVVLASALAGCALFGPSYSKPNTNNPESFPSRDSLAVTESANLPAMAWWKKFNDPVLDGLIESALKNNNNIQQAIGNILAAQGQLQQINTIWIPTVNANTGYQKGTTNATNTTSSATGGGTNNTTAQPTIAQGYSAGLVASYAINIFQLIRAQEYAEANYRMQIAAKNAVRLTIISQVVGGYFTLRGQDYLLELQEQLAKDLKNLLDLSTIEYKEGLISLYQLQQYQEQYQEASAQIPVIQSNIVASRNTLRLLLNQNPGDVKRGKAFMDFDSHGIIPANLPSQVLRNRPDVAEAEEGLIAANANIGVAISQFFPTINLTGEAGLASSQFNNLFNAGNSFWDYSVGALMPALNFSIYGQINQARGQYYTAYYNYIQTVRNAFASVDSDLVAHDKLTQSFDTELKFYDSTALAYMLAESSFSAGLYSKPTLLNNAVTMDNAAIVVAQSKQTQLNTIVQLYQDLGGGYNYQNTESANKFGDAHDFRDIF